MAGQAHSDLTGLNLHVPFHYIQSSDPGAVGADKYWLDTTSAPYLLYVRDATNTSWIQIAGAGGSFVDLTSTQTITGIKTFNTTSGTVIRKIKGLSPTSTGDGFELNIAASPGITDGGGGALTFNAGNGVGTDRQGGYIDIISGNGIGTADGGVTSIYGGNAGNSGGAGGDIFLNPGKSLAGTPGAVWIANGATTRRFGKMDMSGLSATRTYTFQNASGTLAFLTDITGGVTDGDKGDITVSSSGTVWTVDNSAITLAKIANATASSKLLGSGATGSGSPYAEITLGTNLSMSGTTLNASGSGGITIGDAVASGGANRVLFEDASQNLATDANFLYSVSGSIGTLKLLEAGFTSGMAGGAVAALITGNNTAYTGTLTNNYFGIYSDVTRGGNNGIYQTSGIRGVARYAGSSTTYPVATGGEFFAYNAGATTTQHMLQGVEGIAQATENLDNVQGAYAQASQATGKTTTSFLAGGWFQISNSGATAKSYGVRSEIVSASTGTTTDAYGVYSNLVTSGTHVVTNAYGLNMSGWSGSGFTNSYGIYMDTSIDVGSTSKYAIYSLSTSPSLLTGYLTIDNAGGLRSNVVTALPVGAGATGSNLGVSASDGGGSPGGAGGVLILTGGDGTGAVVGHDGGHAQIYGGNAGAAGNANGGDILLTAGAKIGSGTDGNIIFADPTSAFRAIWSTASLSANRTYTLPNTTGTIALVQNASANSVLVGAGATGSGSPYTEITLGTNLSMSGTTLNAAGGGGGTPGGVDTQVQFNDSSAFGGDAGLTYNKTTDTLSINGIPFGKGAGTNSIQIGTSTSASGNSSIAIGNTPTATTTGAIAIGDLDVTGAGGIGIGTSTGAISGQNSILITGSGGSSTKLSTIAIGTGADATQDFGIAIGVDSICSTTGSNDNSMAIGPDATVSNATESVALGAFATVTHNNSVALGANTSTSATNQVAIGQGITQVRLNNATVSAILDISSVATSSKTFTFPNTTGTLALTSQLYTDEQAQDAVGGMIDTSLVYVDATPLLTRAALTGDVTASQGSNATTIANDAVTLAKIQNAVANSKLLGSGSAGAGTDYVEITLGTNLSMSGTTLNASGSGSGLTRSVNVTSTSYTAGSTALTDYIYLIAGAHTTTLPTASGNSNRYTFKNNHSANVTINRAGADTIEGATSLTLGVGEAIDLISDGTSAWYVL